MGLRKAQREAGLNGYMQIVVKLFARLVVRAKLNSMGTDVPFLVTNKTTAIIVAV